MVSIRLQQGTWLYDPNKPLGPRGGFGQVYAGHDPRNRPIAVKKLHLTAQDAAHRELRIADELVERDLDHVIPVLDAGKDTLSDSYFVVMSRAEKSLQQEIDAHGAVQEAHATVILLDIALALREVGDIVHRDLKPANVLYHDGRWKVADFGIARFVEESTSARTLRKCLTPPYAAPEQWSLERATSQTDIYALGCIAHALFTGKPPFPGPSRADFKHQHLHEVPDPLPASPQLVALVSTALRKPPAARPAIDRLIDVLQTMQTDPAPDRHGSGFGHLASAGAEVAEQALREDAAQTERKSIQRQRVRLANDALVQLVALLNSLEVAIMDAAPSAYRLANNPGDLLRIQLGTSQLNITQLRAGRPIPREAFQASQADVVVGAIIEVVQRQTTEYKWRASLWYSEVADRPDGYRWREYLYMNHPLARRQATYVPFALGDLGAADAAASPGQSEYQLAATPVPIDGEDIDQFRDRWMKLLAKAAKGQLRSPRHLPLT
jgi:serine/threonine-protein kinase